ncbi:uncharacterized protein ACWYII_013726 isoform 2-T2 [Salvelinus alpinus]
MAVSFFGKVIIPFLAYFLVEVTGEQQYGGLGGEITLTPKVSGQPEDILWKHIGNKVVEFDGSQNVEYGRYKGRTILDWDSGALTIKGLTDADSGPYELEAVVKGKLQYSHHEVDVIDNVAQPSVTCVVDNTNPENMDRTLLCSADLQPLTQFIWSSPGGSESPGPELFIPGVENQESENQDSVYTCVVKNPVSERTAEFTLKDCHTEGGSSRVLAVVLSILLLLVLVVVLAFLLWCWRKGKKPAKAALKKSEEEAGLLEVTVQGNVKEVIELLNKQNADANRKQHTAPAGRCFSPTKSGGHSPLYIQNDSLSDRQTVTDTEPVQDKPNPAQPKLVTPESKEAQLGMNTPEPNQETAPERETDSAGTTEPTRGQTDGTTEPARDQTDGTTEPARDQTDGTTEPARDQTDSAGTTEPARGQTDGTTEPAPGQTDSAGTTEPARDQTDGTTEPARDQTDSAGTTEPARDQTDSAGTTEPARDQTDSAGTTEPAPGQTDSAGTTEPAPGQTDGTTEPARDQTDGTTEPARDQTDSAGTTEPAPGQTDSAGTTEPARDQTDSAGTTEPARDQTDSAGTTEPARDQTDSAGTTEPAGDQTDSGATAGICDGQPDRQ